MGFFAAIGRGWEMSKLSMSVVKKDPELLVYMIISGVMSLGQDHYPEQLHKAFVINAPSLISMAHSISDRV